ncbi:MAG: hypothetical protein L0H63_05660 [Nitrococcus sp.]|nr:hypothetical protein [Nitrococcus sp.]
MTLWACLIGDVDEAHLPRVADSPMRKAVAAEYRRLTGQAPTFIYSGWDGELRETEREAVDIPTPTPADGKWLVWSNEHGAWWRPAKWGYTRAIEEAGRYTRAEADAIVAQANIVIEPGERPNEVAVLAPG